jgi:hypothetical protein
MILRFRWGEKKLLMILLCSPNVRSVCQLIIKQAPFSKLQHLHVRHRPLTTDDPRLADPLDNLRLQISQSVFNNKAVETFSNQR